MSALLAIIKIESSGLLEVKFPEPEDFQVWIKPFHFSGPSGTESKTGDDQASRLFLEKDGPNWEDGDPC